MRRCSSVVFTANYDWSRFGIIRTSIVTATVGLSGMLLWRIVRQCGSVEAAFVLEDVDERFLRSLLLGKKKFDFLYSF